MRPTDLVVTDNFGNKYRLVKIEPKASATPSLEFSKWLISERDRLNITQARLEELSGVKQPNIAAYETGKRKPKPGTVEKLKVGFDKVK